MSPGRERGAPSQGRPPIKSPIRTTRGHDSKPAVPAEVAAEAVVRIDAGVAVLRRLDEAQRAGTGPYAGVPAELLAWVPRVAIETLRPARDRLAVELAEVTGS
jgi:hypothetical protein